MQSDILKSFIYYKYNKGTLCFKYTHYYFTKRKFHFITDVSQRTNKKDIVSFIESDVTEPIEQFIQKEYKINETFSSCITKKRKLFNLIPYERKEVQENIYYKKDDGSGKAFLYSNKIKPLKYCERLDELLYVQLRASNKMVKKNLFDILYNKNSLIFFFTHTNHINEMNEYLNDIEERKKETLHGDFDKIVYSTYIRLKKEPIYLFYCYVPPYKLVLGNYVNPKVYEQLRNTYFQNKSFFFINDKLKHKHENSLLLDNTSLPSLLLIDHHCFIRYHIKGLFTKESSYFLYNVLMNL